MPNETTFNQPSSKNQTIREYARKPNRNLALEAIIAQEYPHIFHTKDDLIYKLRYRIIVPAAVFIGSFVTGAVEADKRGLLKTFAGVSIIGRHMTHTCTPVCAA